MLNTDFVEKCRKLVGRAYADIDCIRVVTKPLGLHMAGTNWLWRSINNSAKYRYLKWRVAEQPDPTELETGDVVFKIKWEQVPEGYDDCPNCHHVGVYMGDGTVCHSSPKTGVRIEPFNPYEWDGWGRLMHVEYVEFPREAEKTVDGISDHDMLKALYEKYC